MRSIASFSTKILTTGLALALSISCAMANTLSEIQINAENDGYGIVLKTDESTHMKKVINSNDKMSIELKNVDVSDSLNTVYNDVANIDNVTVVPTSKSDIKIVLKGKDIAQSKVYFETIKTIPAELTQKTQSIELNGPVSSYTPVYNPENFVEESEDSQTSNPELNAVLTKMHITRSMLVTAKRYAKKAMNKAESSGINPMTAIGIIAIAAAFALRPRKKSANTAVERMSGVGLSATQSRANLDREMSLNSRMASQMNGLSSKGAEPKGMTRSLSAPSAAYGMRAYQKSQRNPYMTPNMPSNGVSGIPRRPMKAAAPVRRKPVVQQPIASSASMSTPIRKAAPQPRAQQFQSSDLDSVKFLESITKIYEKNGRADLAKGLKDNLKKAQMANI